MEPKNGTATQWIMAVVVTLVVAAIAWGTRELIANSQSDAVTKQRVDTLREDVDEIKADVKDVRVEQIEQRIILERIDQKVAGGE